METLTIREVSECCGLTVKAVRNRVYRGQLRSVKRGGLRRIPVSELQRADLISSTDETPKRQLRSPVSPETELIRDLVTRMQRQEKELGELKVLERRAQSLKDAQQQAEIALQKEHAKAVEAQSKAQELGRTLDNIAVAGLFQRQRLLRKLRKNRIYADS